MPPLGALIWPSSEEPVPNGIIGTLWAAQVFTTVFTSSLVSTKTTPSGSWAGR
jgi:hypothetical protein